MSFGFAVKTVISHIYLFWHCILVRIGPMVLKCNSPELALTTKLLIWEKKHLVLCSDIGQSRLLVHAPKRCRAELGTGVR